MIFHTISKKPLLLVGNGVRAAGAADSIIEFAQKTNIPVLTTMNAVDLIQDDLRIGFIGTYGNRTSHVLLSECDLLISIGARLGLRQIGNMPEKFAPKAKLIRADIDQYELSRNIKKNEEKYLIDAKDFIEKLTAEEIPDYSKWKETCNKVKETLEPFDKEIGNLVIEKISSLLPVNPIIAVDVGQNQCWSAQSLALKGRKGRILIGGGYGCMGCALPYAIGASISQEKGIVYCITGDGGLQMNIQELEVLKRENLPIKVIVINNYVLGKISEVQAGSCNSRFAQTTSLSGYSVPDFTKIANAYGIKSITLSSYEELNEYAEWFVDTDPCLINITIPEDTLLIPKIMWSTGEISPEISESTEEQIISIIKGNLY